MGTSVVLSLECTSRLKVISPLGLWGLEQTSHFDRAVIVKWPHLHVSSPFHDNYGLDLTHVNGIMSRPAMTARIEFEDPIFGAWIITFSIIYYFMSLWELFSWYLLKKKVYKNCHPNLLFVYPLFIGHILHPDILYQNIVMDDWNSNEKSLSKCQ